MKLRISNILLLAFGFFLPTTSQAEEWSYTGFYPYVYLYSSDSWIYVPNTSPLVWDYSQNNWVTNPLDNSAFNINETFEKFPLVITLAVDGGDSIAITINYSGRRTGDYETGTSSYEIDYNYALNGGAGQYALFGEWTETVDSQTKKNSFSVFLDFDSLTGGSYIFLGDVGLEASDAVTQVSNFSGTFTIE
jgi:hypothetical protein